MSLIENEACTEESARLVVEREFLPIIGEKQRAFEQKTEEMEVCILEMEDGGGGWAVGLFSPDYHDNIKPTVLVTIHIMGI